MKNDAFRIQQIRHRLTKIRNVVNWQIGLGKLCQQNFEHNRASGA